ncbi:Reverse transcriptase (RNA-dependent DNA polymerase) [Popillia japonica]|uniref:Reverse transcriptase (RNA-dependent DNA polymerase) n=1 Tax=Popillia japonica TaxID=7064 RepID=A0AAW1KPU3_POPJA
MQNLLQGLKGIEILADDIIIYGTGDTELDAIKEHNENLENLLRRLKENNCKLNKDKLKLCKNEVKFYGHYLTSNGLNPDYSKVEAIQNFPRPEDKKSLLQYLGMVNYLLRKIRKKLESSN